MRLIDKVDCGENVELDFKNWVIQHNPKLKWDFNNPRNLVQQLSDTISVSGDFDLKTLFELFYSQNESGLTLKQDDQFLNRRY